MGKKFERGKSTSLVVVPNAPKADDVSQIVEQRMRYAIPMQALDNIQLAGVVASSRMLDLITNDEEYQALKPLEKLRLLEMSMTQAFGRVDSAIQEQRANPTNPNAPKGVALRENLTRLNKLVVLPELKKSAS